MVRPSKVKSAQHLINFAEGGSTRMFGTGDRTTTAAADAAGKQKPGVTAHKTSGSKQKYAKGGKIRPVGGTAERAKPGRTGPSAE